MQEYLKNKKSIIEYLQTKQLLKNNFKYKNNHLMNLMVRRKIGDWLFLKFQNILKNFGMHKGNIFEFYKLQL